MPSYLSEKNFSMIGFHDLIATGTCIFFEADRPRHLWHLDEFMACKFMPLCAKFGFSPQEENP